MNRRDEQWRSRRVEGLVGPIAVVAFLAALVSCSGGDEATVPDLSPAPSPTSVAEPSPTSPGEPPTVEESPDQSTTTSASTSTTVGSSSTTTPPVETAATTRPELTPDEQAVIEAARRSTQTWIEVLRDPFDEELIEAAAAVRTGDSLARLIEVVASLRTSGVRSVASPDRSPTVEVYAESLQFEGPDRVMVESCHIDTDWTIEVGAAPDGSDLVVDDSIVAKRERVVLVRVDGQWLDESGTQMSRTEGSVSCEA